MSRVYMYGSLAILSVVVGLSMEGQLYAGPCGVVTSRNYVANGYNNVAVSNYHVPTATYAPLYHNQFVPVVQQVQVVPDFFYSSAGYARDEALLEALKLLREKSHASSSEGKRYTTDDSFDDLLNGIPSLGNKSTSTSGVESIIQAKCVKCHNGSKNNLNLTDLVSLSKDRKIEVYESVADGTMPPTGALSKQEKRLFREWAFK